MKKLNKEDNFKTFELQNIKYLERLICVKGKRFIALLLSVLTIMTMFPTSAFAYEESSAGQNESEQAETHVVSTVDIPTEDSGGDVKSEIPKKGKDIPEPSGISSHSGETTSLVASGNCGDNGSNVQWALYESGTLYIYGSGNMEDYDYFSDSPYYDYEQQITNVVVESGITSIGKYSFFGCYMTNITIPNSVTSIKLGAFWCSDLKKITIPNSVTNIADKLFYECSSLTSITIPNNVTSIGSYAFDRCSSLKDVYYTGTETQWNSISIGSNNSPLTSATKHYNVVATGDCGDNGSNVQWALYSDGTFNIHGSGNMKDYSLSSDRLYDSYKSQIKNVVIEPGLTSIGSDAFYNCTSLTSITIPNSVTSIGSCALQQFNKHNNTEQCYEH